MDSAFQQGKLRVNTETVIMVLIADRTWTQEALHRACILARQRSASILLVKMIPVQHLSWLGTEFGYLSLSEKDYSEIADYQSTIEDYGVPSCVQLFQYATLADALVQCADHVNAQMVFATLSTSKIPFWRKYQLRTLRRRLARHQREFIEQPVDVPASVPASEELAAEA